MPPPSAERTREPSAVGHGAYACSVGAKARRKAVAGDWFGEGAAAELQGRLELTQQTEYDVVNLQLKLDRLDGVSDYRIHGVSVPAIRPLRVGRSSHDSRLCGSRLPWRRTSSSLARSPACWTSTIPTT